MHRICSLQYVANIEQTIEADWGDEIEVTVTNHLESNGTGVHWHGLRQLGSNEMDGTNGLTECPIAPGATKVYRFKATQYGTAVSLVLYKDLYGHLTIAVVSFALLSPVWRWSNRANYHSWTCDRRL
jgi:hypothetical protein